MKKIYHVVLVKFKANKAHRWPDLCMTLNALQCALPGFLTCTGGPYSSPEGLNQGYTHGLVMTFADAAARDEYLGHPDHDKVKQAFLPDLEGVVAFDFEGE
ncbi:MAG: Dabb family protein [Planctomycetes bacterium]|nr:Dabb family protein [Planctomycetota bacterium]